MLLAGIAEYMKKKVLKIMGKGEKKNNIQTETCIIYVITCKDFYLQNAGCTIRKLSIQIGEHYCGGSYPNGNKSSNVSKDFQEVHGANRN